MKSHQTEFRPRDLLRIVGGPVLVAAACAAFLQAMARVGVLPTPRPALDADRTILIHQVDAARTQNPEIILIGDSSCLMNVAADQLSDALKTSVLNLGTFSYLDLTAYSALLRENQRRHTPKAVVLLMHPEGLRRLGSETYQLGILNDYVAGRDNSSTATAAGAFNAWAAVDIVSGRLIARMMPTPLRGDYGTYYGFTRDLDRFMTRHSGSAFDPGHEPFKGNAEYRLAPTMEKASRAFRAAIAPQTKLIVGITPVPDGFVRGGFPNVRDQLLQQWTEWLGTTNRLSTLPATLPEDRFARVTHLRPGAVADYTATLADALRTHLP